MKIEDIKVNPLILRALHELGFAELTNIQEKCIPEIIEGRDIVGQSSTGSGKTAAFGVPILDKIVPHAGLQFLVLTPTRELCVQDTDFLKDFSKHIHLRIISVYGGVGIEPQMQGIKTAEVVVGTPGRILDHLQRRTISFDKVRFLVLDEADKMFEMGFIEDVEKIISQTPKHRQTMLFSATMPSSVIRIVQKHQNNPKVIRSELYVDKSLMKQIYFDIKAYEKFSLLVFLLKKEKEGLDLIFCATRHEVDNLTANLRLQGIHAMAIHGGLTQNKRQFALDSLRGEKISILVATDVAARGLDIKNVTHVYNYDSPKTSDEYLHRIGRTARAGSSGKAVTLLCEKDHDNFRNVLRDPELDITREEIPDFPSLPFHREPRQFERPGFRGRDRGPPMNAGRQFRRKRFG